MVSGTSGQPVWDMVGLYQCNDAIQFLVWLCLRLVCLRHHKAVLQFDALSDTLCRPTGVPMVQGRAVTAPVCSHVGHDMSYVLSLVAGSSF